LTRDYIFDRIVVLERRTEMGNLLQVTDESVIGVAFTQHMRVSKKCVHGMYDENVCSICLSLKAEPPVVAARPARTPQDEVKEIFPAANFHFTESDQTVPLLDNHGGIFFDPEVLDQYGDGGKSEQTFCPQRPSISDEQFKILSANHIHNYLDFPKSQEAQVRAEFEANGLKLPEDCRPINTGARGGTVERGGAQIKMWFEDTAEVRSQLPANSYKVDQSARTTISPEGTLKMYDSKFALELLARGIPLTGYTGKKKSKNTEPINGNHN
jgi:hypothetical protein